MSRRIQVIATNLKTGEERVFDSYKEAANGLGISPTQVSVCARGASKSTKGFTFQPMKCAPWKMKRIQAEIIVALADSGLNMKRAGDKLYRDYTSISYHVNQIKANTGKDPRDFHDMIYLLEEAKKVLEESGYA
ncbi:MAG: hypothetical protein IJX67_10825 [Oscillospiraceae bacterium]|nr:hypothetical protein [Oscillospiraceae bacterium]